MENFTSLKKFLDKESSERNLKYALVKDGILYASNLFVLLQRETNLPDGVYNRDGSVVTDKRNMIDEKKSKERGEIIYESRIPEITDFTYIIKGIKKLKKGSNVNKIKKEDIKKVKAIFLYQRAMKVKNLVVEISSSGFSIPGLKEESLEPHIFRIKKKVLLNSKYLYDAMNEAKDFHMITGGYLNPVIIENSTTTIYIMPVNY